LGRGVKMSLEDVAKKARKPDQPIYIPPPPSNREEEEKKNAKPLLKDLVNFLWESLLSLKAEIETAEHDKHRAQLYLAIASQARILAGLLNGSGMSRGERQDLAKILSRIEKTAKTKARAIWRGGKRRRSLEP